MAEDERSPRANEIYVPLAVYVEDMTSLAARDEYGHAAYRLPRSYRAVYAPGDFTLSAVKIFLGSLHLGSVSVANIAPHGCQQTLAVRKIFFFLFFSCKEI